jgi:hypothetical protein
MQQIRCTSGKKAISGAPIWTMRGAYGMRHHCHATSKNLSVAHLKMHHIYAPLMPDAPLATKNMRH